MESKRMTAEDVFDAVLKIISTGHSPKSDISEILKLISSFGNQRFEEGFRKGLYEDTSRNMETHRMISRESRKSALEDVINLIKDKINGSWDIPHELIDEIQALIDKKEGV